MPEFSEVSLERLSECHDDLVLLFATVVAEYDCSIVCGHRDKATQNRAYMEDNSLLQWPQSNHNKWPSMAVDVAPYPIDWEDAGAFYTFIGWVLCTAHRLYKEGRMTHRVRTGSDWDMDGKTTDQIFKDLAHWELVK
ncbi:MAG: hypothetical protein KAT62_01820 [Desulfuromonadales bacterium]|nr:hypothetical protein [Desulfuromonadales bacterium]